jgi:hypothetical protein
MEDEMSNVLTIPKEGELIMVDRPVGRGGPYEVDYADYADVYIMFGDKEVKIPIEWTEVVPF